MTIPVPYALRNGILVSIDEVERGLKCNCTCPDCHQPLIARMGEKRVAHFAHQGKTNCKGGLETIVHKICKEIIAENLVFTTPRFFYERELIPKKVVIVEEVLLEKRLDNIVPDIIIKTENRSLLIEIVVTHDVDIEKENKIRALNLAAIRINARDLVQNLFDKGDFKMEDPEFREELINGTQYKSWIFNPKGERLKDELINSKQEEQSLVVEGSFKEFMTEKPAKKPKKTWVDDGYPGGRAIEIMNFKKTDGSLFYFVDSCPRYVRRWKSGIRKGRPYATVHDCFECPFLNKHIPDEKPEYSGTVYCLGEGVDPMKFDIEGSYLIEEINKTGRFIVKSEEYHDLFYHRYKKALHRFILLNDASIWDATDKEKPPVFILGKKRKKLMFLKVVVDNKGTENMLQ